jgi:hypothetical protein
MPHLARASLTLVLLLTAGVTELLGQTISADGPPAPLQPRKPPTRQERDRREAQKLYALALIQQSEDRILEATRTLEEARQLDPEAAPLL